MTWTLKRGLALAGLSSIAVAATLSGRAIADDKPAVQKSPRAGKACVVQGETRMPANLEIFDKEVGGDAIARFTGSSTRLAVLDFPATTSGKVEVQTGTGTGSFRIEGFIDPTKVPLITKTEIPVINGHIWLGKNRQVKFAQATKGRLKVQMKLQYPIRQTFSAWANCSSFKLTPGTPPGFQVPGRARGYVVKKDEITLFDDYRRDRSEISTLYSAGENGILFWSEKQRGGFVRVQYSAEVVIEAWARRRDLKALPRGETMDQLWRGKVTRPAPPRLKVAGTPQEVRTTKEVPIRAKASDKAPVIGRIEADTDVLVVDVVVGYASVLPKKLNLAPAGENHFWADAKALGIQK